MLAIVFWNARRDGTSASLYREALAEFHKSLNSQKPDGFRYSATFQIKSVPWFRPKREVYEDWYIMRNFAAMDVLDECVVESPVSESHRYLMRNTAGACGAAMGLNKGGIRIHTLPEAYWMLKPRSKSVDEVIKQAEGLCAGEKFAFWTRAMALGPHENCLLSSVPVVLPKEYDSVHVHREPVWHP